MVKSDLVATLQTLTEQEQRDLEYFLRSPYFSKGEENKHEQQLVALIFDALAAGEAGIPALDRKVLYAAIYPESQQFAAQTMSNLTTSTLKLAQKFIVAEMNRQDGRKLQQNTQIINFFLQRGSLDLCAKYFKKIESLKDQPKPPDNYDYFYQWRFEVAKAHYLGMQTEQREDYNLQGSLMALEEFFLIERLEDLTSLFNLNRFTPVFAAGEQEQIVEDIDRWSDKPFFQNPVIQLSRKALLFLNESNPQAESVFAEFMALLTQHEKGLSLYYLKRMEAFAYNFCARRFDQKMYRDLITDLYRRRIDPDRLSKENTIHAAELLSIVKFSLLEKQYAWVQLLLNTFRNQIIGPQPSESYYQFCLAMLYFYTKRFDEAQSILIRLHFSDTIYKFMAKGLEVKLIYEVTPNNQDILESKLAAFKGTLTRDTSLSAEKLQVFRNFVNMMIRLNNWHKTLKKNWTQIREMLKEVQNNDNMSEKIWLEAKLKDILKGAPSDSAAA